MTVCANPDQYIFWDAYHPTTYAHGLIANAALLVIPEPGTLLLVATGLVGFALRRHRMRGASLGGHASG